MGHLYVLYSWSTILILIAANRHQITTYQVFSGGPWGPPHLDRLDCVSGKAKKPAKGKDKDTDDSTEELAKWETKLEKAAGEIYLAVESDQRVHFQVMKTIQKLCGRV